MRQGFRIAVLAGLAALAFAAPAAAGARDGARLDRAFLAAAPGPAAAEAPRWSAMIARRAAAEQTPDLETCKGPAKAQTKGKAGDCQMADFDRRLDKLRPRAPLQQIKAVNRAVNALPYVADSTNWGQADYWATPEEMLARGGDCEDFATAKYFALRRLGFAETDLRMAVVWDVVDREQHAVLLVRTGERVLVLDNKRAETASAAALSDRYQVLYTVEDGRIALSLQTAAADAQPASRRSRARIINGGRTLVMQVRPRRAAPTPTPAIELALAETAVPAGR